MTHRWHYSGDVNLEEGGLFWREDGQDDYVLAVQVIPCSNTGGPDNLFVIEHGSIYIPADPEKRRKALDVIGVTASDATRDDLVQAFNAYSGLDQRTEHVVRIGPAEETYRPGWNPEPDAILRGNSKLKNYVRREFL